MQPVPRTKMKVQWSIDVLIINSFIEEYIHSVISVTGFGLSKRFEMSDYTYRRLRLFLLLCCYSASSCFLYEAGVDNPGHLKVCFEVRMKVYVYR